MVVSSFQFVIFGSIKNDVYKNKEMIKIKIKPCFYKMEKKIALCDTSVVYDI